MLIRILDHDYDQFVLGSGPSGVPVLVHLGAPRFVCQVADDMRAVPPDDFVHACGDGRVLHSQAFLDAPVTTHANPAALLAEAESALRNIK